MVLKWACVVSFSPMKRENVDHSEQGYSPSARNPTDFHICIYRESYVLLIYQHFSASNSFLNFLCMFQEPC